MKYDRRTKRFRGFAVIKFEAIESAQKAVEETNLYRIKGKRISINFNKQRQSKGKKSDKTGDETCWFCYNNKTPKPQNPKTPFHEANIEASNFTYMTLYLPVVPPIPETSPLIVSSSIARLISRTVSATSRLELPST